MSETQSFEASGQTPETQLESSYLGSMQPLLLLGLKTAFFTLITVGLYRFWARTRVRRFFWSAIAPGGHPLEYTGNGLEKFLGFLIAVAFLAVYLGIFQLGLSFAGLSIFSGDRAGNTVVQLGLANIGFLAIVPLIFYAQYRARRYMLARTRWRGLRFGAEQAAWGYVWRAMLHWLVTILTIGILLPRQTFWLEKYKVDRSWYGTAKFQQLGHWQLLFAAAKHLYIGGGLIVISLGFLIWAGVAENDGAIPLVVLLMSLGLIWGLIGYVYYAVHSFRILAENKVLGDGIRFVTTPKTGTVIKVNLLGSMAASMLASTVALMLGAIAVVVASAFGFGDMGSMDGFLEMLASEGGVDFPGGPGALMGIVFGYVAFFLLFGAFSLVCIRQPILQHYVAQTKILNVEKLGNITQRARDEMVEADGFADALDVGGAI